MRALAAVLLLPSLAWAGLPDAFGLDARAAAMAGAGAAVARGGAAAHHDPALLVDGAGASLTVGYGGGPAWLRVDGRDVGQDGARGLHLALALPFSLGPVRLALGLAAQVPDRQLLRISARPPLSPQFPLLGDALEHAVVEPAIAVAPRPWLSVGVGAIVLADVAGSADLDVGGAAGDRAASASLAADVPTRAAPLLGLRLRLPWLSVAAVYRGEIAVAQRLDLASRVDVAGAIGGAIDVALRTRSPFLPRQVTLAVAARLDERFTLTSEVLWQQWSAWSGLLPDLAVSLRLDTDPGLVAPAPAVVRLRDTFTVRVAGEAEIPVSRRWRLAARAGWAFVPSPLVDPLPEAAVADAARHVVGVGLGASVDSLPPLLARGLALDLGLQWHHLVERALHPAFPVASFRAGGDLLHLAATLTARF